MDMEIHATLESFKTSIYELIVKSKVEDHHLLKNDELEVLAHLCNNVNKKLAELDGTDDKVTYLRNLILTLTATNMIITGKIKRGEM